MQKVLLIGNLGRDPEVRYSQQGTAIAQFSVATTEDWLGAKRRLRHRTGPAETVRRNGGPLRHGAGYWHGRAVEARGRKIEEWLRVEPEGSAATGADRDATACQTDLRSFATSTRSQARRFAERLKENL